MNKNNKDKVVLYFAFGENPVELDYNDFINYVMGGEISEAEEGVDVEYDANEDEDMFFAEEEDEMEGDGGEPINLDDFVKKVMEWYTYDKPIGKNVEEETGAPCLYDEEEEEEPKVNCSLYDEDGEDDEMEDTFSFSFDMTKELEAMKQEILDEDNFRASGELYAELEELEEELREAKRKGESGYLYESVQDYKEIKDFTKHFVDVIHTYMKMYTKMAENYKNKRDEKVKYSMPWKTYQALYLHTIDLMKVLESCRWDLTYSYN